MDHIGDWYTTNHGHIYEKTTLSTLSWYLPHLDNCLIAIDNFGGKIAVFEKNSSRLKLFNGQGQLLKNNLWKNLVEIYWRRVERDFCTLVLTHACRQKKVKSAQPTLHRQK